MKPMLAHDYKKRGHNITYPAYVQPKFDGIRCLATRNGDTITYTSRDEKEFPAVSHLTPHLLRLMRDGDVWDGELYTKRLTFQEIVSAVKRNKTTNPDTAKIEYHVYDVALSYGIDGCVVRNMPFEQRHLYVDACIKNGGPIIPVTTLLVECEEDMLACHKTMLSYGYEGTMIRNKDGLYTHKRSADLQKYKDMEDAEFKIVDAVEGEGKDKGCIIFVCSTPNPKGVGKGRNQYKDHTFTVRPNGTYYRREKMWKERKQLIGKMLTVQYQGLSDDGIPRFPIGLEVRDYE